VTEAVKGQAKTDPDAGRQVFSRVTAMSTLVNVVINGVEFYAYFVPVETPLQTIVASGKEPVQARYVICGLVGRGHFRARALSVHGGTVAWICLAAVVALTAAWPLFRLTQMRASERVRRKTGLRLVLAALATTTLLTLLVFHGSYHLHDTDTKDQLSRVRNAIDSSVSEEVGRALELLEAVPRDPAFSFARAESGAADSGLCDFNHVVAAKYEADILSRKAFVFYSYPYFEGVSFADWSGGQNVKWSVRRQPTPSINLCGFPSYYQTARGQLWKLAGGSARFRVDPLYSPNTGEYLAVISRPVDPSWVPDAGGRDLRVGSVITPLASLIDPVMPPDFGFAVVDESGRVLFHSSAAKNQRENILAVAEPAADLAATIQSRLRRTLNMQYEGQRVVLEIAPFQSIQGCPWSLIVFRRLEPREAMHLETIAHFFVFAILYAVLLFAGQLLVLLPHYPNAWMWPQWRNVGAYRLLTRASIVVGIAALIWIFNSPPGLILAAALVLPAASILAVALTLSGRLRHVRILASVLVAASLLAIWLYWRQSPESGWRVEDGLQLGCLAAFWLAAILVSSRRAAHVLKTRFSPCLRLARMLLRTAPPPIRRAGLFLVRGACRIGPSKLEGLYATAGVFLVALASLVPCVAFFKLAYDHHRLAFVKRNQILTMRALAVREERIKTLYRNVRLPDDHNAGGASRWLFLRDRLEWKIDRFDRALNEAGPDFRLPPRKPGFQAGDSACETHLPFEAELLGILQVIPNPLASPLRALHASDDATGNGWVWTCEGSSRIRMIDAQRPGESSAAQLHPLTRFRERDPVLTPRTIVSGVPELRNLNALAYALLAAILVGAYWWIRHTVRHLFLLLFSSRKAWPRFDLTYGIIDRNLLLLCEPLAGASRALAARPEVEVVDATIFTQADIRISLGDKPVVAVDHCGSIVRDEVALGRMLDFIERMARQPYRHLAVLTTFDPTMYLESGPAGDGEDIALRQRWVKALAGFQTMRVIALAGTPLRAAYQALWSTLSLPERAVLNQLAQDGWANHKNYRALESLVRRGIVEQTPVFEIADTGLRDFLLSDSGPVTPAEEASWKSQEEGASWDWLRSVLMILGLALVATFLLLYQQDLWASLVTALGGIAGMGKLISNVQGLAKAQSGGSA
jgi:hypothetical protein